jgi:hypothetical protein
MQSINDVIKDIPSEHQEKLVAHGDDDKPIQTMDRMCVPDHVNMDVEINSDKDNKKFNKKLHHKE